jgi:hypothetical protein
MAKAGSVQYIVDERGRKKSVVMSYKTYQRLLEDLADLACMEERKNDTRRDLDSVLAELKDAGRL